MEKEWYKIPKDIDSVKLIIIKRSKNRLYKEWAELLKYIDYLYWEGDVYYSPFEKSYNEVKKKANEFYRDLSSLLEGIENGRK